MIPVTDGALERAPVRPLDLADLPALEAFAVAWAEDRAMPLEQAIEYALAEND